MMIINVDDITKENTKVYKANWSQATKPPL